MKKKKNTLSQIDLLMEFFKKHPHKNIQHPEVVDWATKEWKKRTGNVFRDPDRGIRSLHQKGFLVKAKKGVYRYEPQSITRRKSEDFTQIQKENIFKKDNYKCVICGKGKENGIELHADHIKPKDLGGKAEVSNGQTLCSQHNFLKKNLKQTETGKKMFIRLYELAKKEKNKKLQKFCSDILKTYEQHGINGHIIWKK